ncbi:single-stranded DNA-binding protein WHY2, mitochondrial isoform X2 [Ricinus communis]|uniref:single-stranded DNA-binding protein WHY2, mitochondrial isoform X2 n=1 Tax=Ricinus communis TaxID=3988 RepID=UPI00201A86D6|nr:single-stranded DNA-binding protein WHY2, mitochondrial isoform X2 [Ricinus communis]
MMKLSRLLQQSRNSLGKSIDARDVSALHDLTFRAGISTFRQDFTIKGSFEQRVYAPYSVYKGKAALSVQPVLPTFSKLDSGHLKVERRGVILLTFLPAIGERKYDYEKRQSFALSTTEVGSLISLGPKDSFDCFHDPGMLSSNAGEVRKSLSLKPHAEGGGYFISLTVVNNILGTNDRFSVPLTAGEIAVLKTACSFALPHIMGWDRLTAKTPRNIVGNPPKVDRQMTTLEWDR